jgi:hypothetical protein
MARAKFGDMTMNIMNNNEQKIAPIAPAVSPENRATDAVNTAFDSLTEEQINRHAGRGAKLAADELVATVDQYTVEGLEKLGAASVRRAARATLAARYKAHCAKR